MPQYEQLLKAGSNRVEGAIENPLLIRVPLLAYCVEKLVGEIADLGGLSSKRGLHSGQCRILLFSGCFRVTFRPFPVLQADRY